jgi:hypothetical protein
VEVGRFWRDRASDARAVAALDRGRPGDGRFGGVGRAPDIHVRDDAQATAICSTGWWVGPSSPRPMESWVNTKIWRCFISAAMRRALRA